ncbi:MAG: RNA 2',3'-cyclic phosphodiesterase [Actinomycetota bacterium]
MARDRASRPEARPLRLFIAVDVPEHVRAVVADAIEPWRERFPRGRWVPKQNWHVTMKFLGSTWPRLVEWVTQTVAEVARHAEPFESRLEGLGVFQSPQRARVLWAGLTDPDGWFRALAAGLDESLAEEFPPEKRPFTPHLTVARFEPPVELDPGEAAEVSSEPFPVDRLVLYRSHLQRPAPRYEPVAELPFSV